MFIGDELPIHCETTKGPCQQSLLFFVRAFVHATSLICNFLEYMLCNASGADLIFRDPYQPERSRLAFISLVSMGIIYNILLDPMQMALDAIFGLDSYNFFRWIKSAICIYMHNELGVFNDENRIIRRFDFCLILLFISGSFRFPINTGLPKFVQLYLVSQLYSTSFDISLTKGDPRRVSLAIPLSLLYVSFYTLKNLAKKAKARCTEGIFFWDMCTFLLVYPIIFLFEVWVTLMVSSFFIKRYAIYATLFFSSHTGRVDERLRRADLHTIYFFIFLTMATNFSTPR